MAESAGREDELSFRRLILDNEHRLPECICSTSTGLHDLDCPFAQAGAHSRHSQLAVRLPPVSRQQLLGIQIIQHVGHLHPHSAWIELLPTRLGFNTHTDLAALALAESLDYHFGGRIDESHSNAAFLCYDKAVSHLRNAIESAGNDGFQDATLITVALLAMCEVMMNTQSSSRQKNVFIHWSGLKSVFVAKYQPSEVSDMGRAILYNLWDCSFGVACATGTASPFDNGQWSHLDPVSFHGLTADAFILRKLTNILCFRSPTLIACVRSLRQGVGTFHPDLVRWTASMALELSKYRDDAAESAMLHRVRVAKTEDVKSQLIVPYSYTFSNVDDFNAAVLYWSMRQVVLNLCLAIHQLAPPGLSPFDQATVESMKTDKERYAANQMMSWEYAESLGPFETLLVAKGLLPNWLQLRSTTTFKNIPTKAVRAWALPKMNHQFNEWLSEDMRESGMDVAADLLVGGPLIGFIGETGSQSR